MNSAQSSESGQGPGVFVSIVTWNSEASIVACLEAAIELSQVRICVLDNASTDSTLEKIRSFESEGVEIHSLAQNIGFCAGHNLNAAKFLQSDCQAFLTLNPDLRISNEALALMLPRLDEQKGIGTCTPLILRCDAQLKALEPAVIDAAGMVLHSSFRHFDRFGGELLEGKQLESGYVFAGTGACLLCSRSFVQSVALPEDFRDRELSDEHGQRVQLFDEKFFAYREDAELGFRAQRLGYRCYFDAKAKAYHQRRVTPERRDHLPAIYNRLGVQNRFLLQLNHASLRYPLSVLLEGFVWRNILVLLAVLLKEWKSLPALSAVISAVPRARKINKWIEQKNAGGIERVFPWFKIAFDAQASSDSGEKNDVV